MPSPRELADLPYASYLEPFRGQLASKGDYDTVHFDGCEFEDAQASGARFTESAFTSVAFAAGSCRGARLNDCWLHAVRWLGTDLVDADWLDVEVATSVLAGLEMHGAQLRRVTFYNCKFDSVNARTTNLRDVRFVDCLLRDVDFSGATLTNIAFPGSSMHGVRFKRAHMAKLDLRGATRMGIADGHDALNGAVISTPQLLDLAPMLAHVLGIAVQDD